MQGNFRSRIIPTVQTCSLPNRVTLFEDSAQQAKRYQKSNGENRPHVPKDVSSTFQSYPRSTWGTTGAAETRVISFTVVTPPAFLTYSLHLEIGGVRPSGALRSGRRRAVDPRLSEDKKERKTGVEGWILEGENKRIAEWGWRGRERGTRNADEQRVQRRTLLELEEQEEEEEVMVRRGRGRGSRREEKREEAGSYACSAPPTLSETHDSTCPPFSPRTATRKSVSDASCHPALTDGIRQGREPFPSARGTAKKSSGHGRSTGRGFNL